MKESRKKRFLWLIVGLALTLVLIAGAVEAYGAYYASKVNPTHKAAGAISVTVTPTPTPGNSATATSAPSAQVFQIVPAQTTAQFSVYEDLVLEGKPNYDAIGKTNSVTGNTTIVSSGTPAVNSLHVQVDLRTLQTDDSRRDQKVQTYLETSQYPYATFDSVSTANLPSAYADGQTITFKLTGNLTLHGKTNAETFDVTAKISGKTLTGSATTTIYMTDFGVQPPNLANVAIVQNNTVLTLNFTATSS